MVTEREWLSAAARRLAAAGCADAGFDARCLLEDLGGLPRGHAPGDRVLTAAQEQTLGRALTERENGRPLQYILGQWEMLTLSLAVGEGVLIPRPDTELLCETAAARLAERSGAQVLDLCAGSGCVGLGIASLCPQSGLHVTAVELSEDALPYLRENLRRYPQFDVRAVRADVLTDAGLFPAEGFDAIVSNPPYIPSGELPALQREVQREPAMALDGGGDGLMFYRAIAGDWLSRLKTGGFLAVEVGAGQAAAVAALFSAAGLTEVRTLRDLAGICRVVIGVKGG